MINILSYVGMSLQAEICLWTLLGVVKTVFDTSIFHIKENLKQVWQLRISEEILGSSVQRLFKIMMSAIVLLRTFTAHIYLAAFIVLLYPVVLEERPGLVLPWLGIGAARALLTELLALAVGLIACLAHGAIRPVCVFFVFEHIATILPALYLWILVLSYYRALRIALWCRARAASTARAGLDLAVRRRRAKSLYAEPKLLRTLTDQMFGAELLSSTNRLGRGRTVPCLLTDAKETPETSDHDVCLLDDQDLQEVKESAASTADYWLGYDLRVRRDADRVGDQLAGMALRVAAAIHCDADCPAARALLEGFSLQTISQVKHLPSVTAISLSTTDLVSQGKIPLCGHPSTIIKLSSPTSISIGSASSLASLVNANSPENDSNIRISDLSKSEKLLDSTESEDKEESYQGAARDDRTFGFPYVHEYPSIFKSKRSNLSSFHIALIDRQVTEMSLPLITSTTLTTQKNPLLFSTDIKESVKSVIVCNYNSEIGTQTDNKTRNLTISPVENMDLSGSNSVRFSLTSSSRETLQLIQSCKQRSHGRSKETHVKFRTRNTSADSQNNGK